MSLSQFSQNAKLLAAQLNVIVDHLQGASGKTDAWHLRASTNILFTLSDNAGASKFSLRDLAEAEVFAVNSNGDITNSGSFAPGSLTLPSSAAPAQTTDGAVAWDSDDDRLTVGTGAATKVIGLSRGAGLNASATQELAYDTTTAQLNVWDGAASRAIAVGLAGVRADFRNNRRIVALWSGSDDGSPALGFGYGSGVWDSVSQISGEPIGLITTTGTKMLLGATDGTALLSPNHSPRMLLRIQFPAASANVTYLNIGFIGTAGTTANGAYIRIVTTGDVFFVTRQGGSETATNIGTLSRTTVLGFEIETADDGVTWVCRNQAGVAKATHTTNVPTAATGLNYGYAAVIATAGVSHGVAFMHVEGTFA